MTASLAGLLLAALFLFANPLLDPEHFALLWSDPDIAWQAYPMKALIARSIGEGRLPLDQPHIFGGMPFAGNPQAQLFYPGTLLFLVLPLQHAFAMSLVLHLALAFAGTYLLARHGIAGRAASPQAALYAAIVYAFSGSLSTQIQQTAILHTSAWMPLFFYGLLAYRPWLTAAATSGLLLSGHTQMASYALALGALALILDAFRSFRGGRGRDVSGLFRSCAGVAAGLLLSLVMLVPAAELLSLSMRGRGVSEAFAAVNAFQDWHFPLVTNPAAYASLHGDKYWTYPFVGSSALVLALAGLLPAGRGRSSLLDRALFLLLALSVTSRPLLTAFVSMTKGQPTLGAFYLEHWDLLVALGRGWAFTSALVPLLLLLVRFVIRPERSLLWGLLCFLSLALALGPSAPLVGGLFQLPVLAESRGAVRFFHLYALMVALLAAAGLQRFVGSRGRLARLTFILPILYLVGLRFDGLRQRFVAMPFALAALVSVTWLFLSRWPRGAVPSRASLFVPPALALLELFTFGTQASRVSNPELYRYADADELIVRRDPEARILILREGDLGYFETAFCQNAGMVRGYDAALGYEPLALRTATELVNIARPMAFYDRDGRLAELRDMARVASSDFVHPGSLAVLALLRVRYIVTKGFDLLSEARRIPVDGVGSLPARRSFVLSGEARECYVLTTPSAITFRMAAAGAPTEIHLAAGPDPRLLGGGWPGARVEIVAEVAGEPLARGTLLVEGDAASRSFQALELAIPATATGEALIKVRVESLDQLFGGFSWVGITHPVALASDAERASALRQRIRFLGMPGAAPGLEGAMKNVRLYELDGALPRCLAPERTSPADPATSLADPSFHPARTLLLPGEPERLLPKSRVISARRHGARTDVRYESADDTTLLLADAYYPGLVARVDGRPARLRPADLHFGAVDVPGGQHTLSVTYEPFSYRLGLFGTAATILVLLVLSLQSMIRPAFGTRGSS